MNERGREHDLGKGFTLSEYLDASGQLIGYFVTGPAAPACASAYEGRCGGLCAVREHVVRHGDFERRYSVWQSSGDWPNITLSPSVACGCGGQHSFVVDGRWQ